MADDIEQILKEASTLEHTDDFDRAVALFKKAFDIYASQKDHDNALSVYNKAIRILKREGEFYRVGIFHLKASELYAESKDNINAARCYSRAGTSFVSVSAFSEAAKAYYKAGENFFILKGEFYVEAGKHYKLAAINFINQHEREFVDYNRSCKNVFDSYKTAYDTKNVTYGEYLLYITNFCADVQETLNRNGFYREEKEFYVKKMDYMRLGFRVKPGGIWRYISLSIWKWTCLYGESPLLWVGWILSNLLVCSLLFYSLRLVTDASGRFLSFFESIFFSIDIFATLGFGDYTLVSGLSRFMVALDVMLGYFMMAMLITIFARRLTR